MNEAEFVGGRTEAAGSGPVVVDAVSGYGPSVPPALSERQRVERLQQTALENGESDVAELCEFALEGEQELMREALVIYGGRVKRYGCGRSHDGRTCGIEESFRAVDSRASVAHLCAPCWAIYVTPVDRSLYEQIW